MAKKTKTDKTAKKAVRTAKLQAEWAKKESLKICIIVVIIAAVVSFITATYPVWVPVVKDITTKTASAVKTVLMSTSDTNVIETE